MAALPGTAVTVVLAADRALVVLGWGQVCGAAWSGGCRRWFHGNPASACGQWLPPWGHRAQSYHCHCYPWAWTEDVRGPTGLEAAHAGGLRCSQPAPSLRVPGSPTTAQHHLPRTPGTATPASQCSGWVGTWVPLLSSLFLLQPMPGLPYSTYALPPLPCGVAWRQQQWQQQWGRAVWSHAPKPRA